MQPEETGKLSHSPTLGLIKPNLRFRSPDSTGVTFKAACDRRAVAGSARGRIGRWKARPLAFAQPKSPPPGRLLGDVSDPDVLTELSVFASEEIGEVVHLQSKFITNVLMERSQSRAFAAFKVWIQLQSSNDTAFDFST